eukprot:12885159-Prorocentrum_lima.AAC.1
MPSSAQLGTAPHAGHTNRSYGDAASPRIGTYLTGAPSLCSPRQDNPASWPNPTPHWHAPPATNSAEH